MRRYKSDLCEKEREIEKWKANDDGDDDEEVSS